MSVFVTHADERAVPAHLVTPATLSDIAHRLPPAARTFMEAVGFEAEDGRVLPVPGEGGEVAAILVGASDDAPDPFAAGRLDKVMTGTLRLGEGWVDPTLSALAFGLASYRFGAYRKTPPRRTRLVVPDGVDGEELERTVQAVFFTRDLVNTPANDLGPAELADSAQALGRRHGAKVTITDGEALEAGFPMVAAVGAASPRQPLVIDLVWGDPAAPKVTLVGKGVVFDTGGLNLKPDRAMSNMKKDMGGAANALGLASLVMGSELPVRLRVLVGAVENAVGGAAFRPGDVMRSRKGLTVEIGNTDAEGRLVLADTMALADEEAPDLMIDFATLTGAARVALGPEIPALFTPDDGLAAALAEAAERVDDPVWRLPLWPGYRGWLKSKVADVCHISSQPFAGSVTAALFLEKFVERAAEWAHFDLFAWNSEARPGRPVGGEAQTIRAIHDYLKLRFDA